VNPTREQILDRIGTVPEPCGFLMRTPLSVLEMGLVDAVRIDDGRIEIELVLTDAACVHLSAMSQYIADAVGDLEGVDTVVVVPSSTKMWTPDRVRHNTNSEDAS
jgi:metal-sulfur cluster biosynthetic enzyme